MSYEYIVSSQNRNLMDRCHLDQEWLKENALENKKS